MDGEDRRGRLKQAVTLHRLLRRNVCGLWAHRRGESGSGSGPGRVNIVGGNLSGKH